MKMLDRLLVRALWYYRSANRRIMGRFDAPRWIEAAGNSAAVRQNTRMLRRAGKPDRPALLPERKIPVDK